MGYEVLRSTMSESNSEGGGRGCTHEASPVRKRWTVWSLRRMGCWVSLLRKDWSMRFRWSIMVRSSVAFRGAAA